MMGFVTDRLLRQTEAPIISNYALGTRRRQQRPKTITEADRRTIPESRSAVIKDEGEDCNGSNAGTFVIMKDGLELFTII